MQKVTEVDIKYESSTSDSVDDNNYMMASTQEKNESEVQ